MSIIAEHCYREQCDPLEELASRTKELDALVKSWNAKTQRELERMNRVLESQRSVEIHKDRTFKLHTLRNLPSPMDSYASEGSMTWRGKVNQWIVRVRNSADQGYEASQINSNDDVSPEMHNLVKSCSTPEWIHRGASPKDDSALATPGSIISPLTESRKHDLHEKYSKLACRPSTSHIDLTLDRNQLVRSQTSDGSIVCDTSRKPHYIKSHIRMQVMEPLHAKWQSWKARVRH